MLREPVKTIGAIGDLREHPAFWRWCMPALRCSQQLINAERPTRDTIGQFAAKPTEVMRQWKWIEEFRRQDYKPRPGDEIALYADGRPYNGTHRASALHALGRCVPALIVEPIKKKQKEGKTCHKNSSGKCGQ